MTKIKDLQGRDLSSAKNKAIEKAIAEERFVTDWHGRKVFTPMAEIKYNQVWTSALEPKTSLAVTENTVGEEQVVVLTGPDSVYEIGDRVLVDFGTFPSKKVAGKNDVGTHDVPQIPVMTYKCAATSAKYLCIQDRQILYKMLEK